jgi:hypothetical protein
MKTVIVPAQITSVEDRVAGNLTFTQLLLMIAPVFISTAVYVFLPPFLGYKSYKIVIAMLIIAVFLTLAIRIQGRLIAQWIAVLATYNSRPRYYVFNKNSYRFDKDNPKIVATEDKEHALQPVKEFHHEHISVKKLYAFDRLSESPKMAFVYAINKKGKLYVRVQEND